ncbi:MAG: Cell division ATP-binding protein FtsE [Candidatus Gottesmanbacteria bacterium GW2011_GWB1_43_11]|uniref:Cell division ATP-binding protein FtsE n=1 Tax=Candidatus Gottesmanbacteria bacterium GW2011_GWB1_43_11 TaxID=1618446 RepID=A0A0G1CNM6_9BACT|nr:MAG: Cell division ATP-binding protein FtsE [Candidatus Gottesmanbacteria bacterium GW2011_GWA2_42_16]KKS52348.1 MAG: Cell division ATP-binding protein FtsE [Candidatus Gottesmanbacteria bacterium GW2011_GWA1_42_26]KKS87375.1 MAG: Cell division ATP-binding protein FtsE [Candidatus Gottesmanbacteria bacterium GW2011_GWB1_43_11]OGG10538.1 MAG: cell division ATP-binding protein FtsE [Candidatus Gottesmanbacteria bacterium RIFCSPHIGHO2_01_FULL_43_15]OGG25207.1 MAG: cell division ATP-binding prot
MFISFDQVTKTYGDKTQALTDTSFKVESGEFVFLVGPSGAGKTTILRLLIHDLVPTNGTILLDKLNIATLLKAKIPELRRQVAMVFQDFKVLFDRTVGENVAIALEILGKPPNEITKKVKEVLQLVDLTDKINQFPVQLSAGELQRIAIARSIVGGPKVLLADEPTGNLDPTTSWEILKILREINKLGTTVIMATHNVDIVNSMRKRVISMKKGKIIKDEKSGKYR